MHLMDVDKAFREKAWRQLHKNAPSYIEQILDVTSHKKHPYSFLPPIFKTIQIRRTRQVEHCWRSKNELIRDILR